MTQSLMQTARNSLARALRETMPAYRPVAAEVPPGWRVYRRHLPGLSLYLVFAPRQYESHFTVELGWSDRDVFPTCFATHLFPDPQDRWSVTAPENGGLRFRLTHFVTRPHDRIYELEWDVLIGSRCGERHILPPDPHAVPRAAACIDDALSLVRDCGLPYIAARTGRTTESLLVADR